MFYSKQGWDSTASYTRQTMFKKWYEGEKVIFWIIDIAFYSVANTETDGNPRYIDYSYALRTRQEKRVFIDYAEVFDEYELKDHYFSSPSGVFSELRPTYADTLNANFSASEITPWVYASPTYNWIDTKENVTNPVFTGTTTVTIGDSLYTFELTIDAWTTHYQSSYRTLKVLYTGYTASIYLNYINDITASDVFRILTTIHNCSYRFSDTVFEVSDKDYLNQLSFIPVNDDLIELERTQVRADELDLEALDKVITNDLKLYKAVVSNYYKAFFDLVRFKIILTISTIFNNHPVALGAKLSYDGKDYTIASVNKQVDNIYKITAFNGQTQLLQFSDDGIVLANAQMSDDGVILTNWETKDL
jgi:hypothetical protein